jgi:hypothetical protein
MSDPTTATTKVIKIPGPDHPITIERNPKRLVISIGGTIAVARSRSTRKAIRRFNTFRAMMSI